MEIVPLLRTLTDNLPALFASIVLVQQEPLAWTNSNIFEGINEVLYQEGKIMLLGFKLVLAH